MIEGHYDTFDRAKFTFIESIYDGIGKADAAAEYYFASLNLQRHGYDLNNQDETLLKMANIILKEEVDLEPDEAIHDPWFPQSQYFTGEETVQNPSLQPSRVVAPEPGQPFTGANIQMNPGDPNSDSHHDIDYFGSSLFPLHGDKMADHVAGFYLGDKHDEKTHSEKSAHVENKFFNNHTTPNEEEHLESSFLTDRAHYGKLADDMTNHDIYQRHFDDWKRKNDPLVRLMTEQMHAQGVFDDEEINHRLAMKHMEEAKEGWKDNLKFTDYLLGLEWTTPEERQKVYEHLIKHGGSKKDTPLKLRGGNDWMPRLIANFHQRFGPIYDHWIGKAHIPGFNTKARKERMPSKGREPGPMENKEAFSAVGQDGFQRALEYAQQMGALDEELDVGKIPFLQEDTTDDGKYVVRGLQLRKPTRKTTEMVGETAGSDYRTLLALLGADENGKLHAAGQHPLYKENWNPEEGPFTQEEVDKILRKRLSLTRSMFPGIIGRRESNVMYAPYLDEDDYYDYTDGLSHDSLATYWGIPFKVGGMDKHPQLLFELLHRATLLHGKNHFVPPSKRIKEQSPTSEDIYETAFTEMAEGPKEMDTGPYGKDYPIDQVTTDHDGYEHSLFFMHHPEKNKLTHRYMLELDSDDHLENNMANFLAPFAPRPPEIVESKFNEGDKRNLQLDLGNPLWSINIHSPGSANRRNEAIGINNNFSRHAQSLAPALTNKLLLDDKLATDRTEDSSLQEIDAKLTGKKTGHFKVHHPFTFHGGHDPDARMKDSSLYGAIIAMHKHLSGLPGTPIDIGGRIPEKNLPMSKDNYIQLTNPENYEHMTSANRKRAKELERRIKELELQAPDFEGDASQIIENKIIDLEEQLSMIPTIDPKEFGSRNFVPTHIQMLKDKLNSDDQAYAQLAKRKAAEFPELFDRSLPPDIIEGNLRQFARMLNDYFHQAPSEAHGLSSLASVDKLSDAEMQRSNPMAESAKDFAHNSDVKFSYVDFLRGGANRERYAAKLAEDLGLNPEDFHTQQTMKHFLEDVVNPIIDGMLSQGRDDELFDLEIPIQTVGNFAKHHFKMADIDFNKTLEDMRRTRGFKDKGKDLKRITTQIQQQLLPHIIGGGGKEKRGNEGRNDALGMGIHHSVNPDARMLADYKEELTRLQTLRDKAFTGPAKNNAVMQYNNYKDNMIKPTLGSAMSKNKAKIQQRHAEMYGPSYVSGRHFQSVNESYRMQQTLDSLIYSDPFIEPGAAPSSVESFESGSEVRPIEPVGPNATNIVPSTYNAPKYMMSYGHKVPVTFDYKIGKDGKIDIIPLPEPKRERLVQPTMAIWGAAGLTDVLFGTDWRQYHIDEDQSTLSRHGRKEDNRAFAKSEDVNLATLTNPDIIRKEIGKGVPILQPMHRIFELDDLEHLRGFTGDWIVSVMPEGERGFVKKEDDDVTSTNFTLSDEDKSNFKKVTDNDYHLDVFKTEEGYYIFDVLKYDDKEVHDVPIDDRIKILRGGLEGVENVHVPSASDTRLTDDAGLKVTVEDLQKENEKLLLRDAKSTYMAGELRHPKWVLLSPGNDVVLRVLERRGNGPYTYRLGTGPVTKDEELGDRAVESDGETYMDVGAAFDSDEKYNEGDHVRVNVSNVGESETAEGQKLFTVAGSKIEEEAEGEGLVSQETLSLLAKAEDSQWLCEVYRAGSGIRVVMPQGDVVYKCTQSGQSWTAHSPLASNGYLIRMSESQRPYWAPVAGALLKADVQIAAPAEEQEDKAEVHETEGEGKPLIPPKKIKDSEWWAKQEKEKVLVKGLQLVEKLLKSGAGAVGQSSSGTKGLGIDYATPIESPMGPTNLHDKKTMPDYDVRDMEEDSSIDEETEAKDKPKHMTVPTDEGVLEITEDSAVFRT